MPPEITTRAATPAAAAAEKGKRKMLLHTLAFVGGGAVLGFAYHKLVGCRTGACPITANPYISTIYGAVVGFLIGGAGR
jgi:hypothetical protein